MESKKRLILENVGTIEKADINLNGLTIITGENDTGKSIIGKIVYLLHISNFGLPFKSLINQLFESYIHKKSKIHFCNGENKIINLLKENKIITLLKKNQRFKNPFKKVFWIEDWDGFIFERKLYLNKEKKTKKTKKTKLYEDISKIINGEVILDRKTSSFIYKKKIKNKYNSFRLMDTSSGIKGFGILQLLEKEGEFNKNSMLIINEPETHLHPDWQIKYAKILIYLVKRGVNVLVTSYSPSFIEALNKYSKDNKIDGKTKFYLSEKNKEGKVIIKDKTNDKWEVFEKLARPFERLVFGE
jgi:predicted ATPase